MGGVAWDVVVLGLGLALAQDLVLVVALELAVGLVVVAEDLAVEAVDLDALDLVAMTVDSVAGLGMRTSVLAVEVDLVQVLVVDLALEQEVREVVAEVEVAWGQYSCSFHLVIFSINNISIVS